MFGLSAHLQHRATWKLLPWYVNGSLEAAEQAAVAQHLSDCEICRQEVTQLEALRQQVRTSQAAAVARSSAIHSADATERGLQQVLRRIEDRSPSAGRSGIRSSAPALRWALVAQAAAILLLATLLAWPRSTPAPQSFRTLSDAPLSDAALPDAALSDAAQSSPTLSKSSTELYRIVFRDDAVELEIRQLLQALDATLVDGPSAVGAYTLHAAGGRDEVLARLRAASWVRLAEPLAAR
ncbi:MAG: zf-HC2 domain-containing protein [Acidobacteriota bacterium]